MMEKRSYDKTKSEKAVAARDWSAEQHMLIAWLSLPRDIREPKTLTALGEALNVPQSTLSSWKKIPGLMEAAHDLAWQELRDHVPAAFATIARRAVESEQRTWMDLFLSLVGGSRFVAGANASSHVTTMTDDEAEAILTRAGVLTAHVIPTDE